MKVVEFSADAWQASAPHLNKGLSTRVEAVSGLMQGLDALAVSSNISGQGADGMRAYIREVHGPVLQSLLVALSTFQTAVGVYWNGYGQVDSDGNFRLVRDEFEAHLSQLESGMGQLRGFGEQLRRIAADASHLVALGGAGASAAERTVDDLERLHRIVKQQKETWEAYESSDPGFAQVRTLISELSRIVANVGSLTVGRGRAYTPGSFGATLDRLGELLPGMVEYCQRNEQAAADGWKRVFTEYAEDVDAARREQAGWDLLWDALQITAGVLVTVVGLGLTPFTGGFSLGLTAVGGALLVGGINSAVNHVSIATTGQDLDLAGMAAQWWDASVARPVAGLGGGWEYVGGFLAGAGHAVTGMAQLNVHEIVVGVSALFTDPAAREALWQQVTGFISRVVNGDKFAAGQLAGELASLVIPGTVAAKAARAGGLGGKVGKAGSGLATKGPLRSPKPVSSPRVPGTPAIDELTDEIRKKITAIEKGRRPDPSTYLSPDYIRKHLVRFDGGATRFMTPTNLEKYGLGQRDGSAFVMPKTEVDALIRKTGGDARAMEEALGLPEGFLNSGAVRVDIPISKSERLRMPSGNEAGANDRWIPGGRLPGGFSEGVIDVGRLDPNRYSVSKLY